MRRYRRAEMLCLSLGLAALLPALATANDPDEAKIRRIYDAALAGAGKSFLRSPGLDGDVKTRVQGELKRAFDGLADRSTTGDSEPSSGQNDQERKRRLEGLKAELLEEAESVLASAVEIGGCRPPAAGLDAHVARIESMAAKLKVPDYKERYESLCLTGGKGSPQEVAALRKVLMEGVGEEGRGRLAAAQGAAGRIAAALGSQKAPESSLSIPQSRPVDLGAAAGSAQDATAAANPQKTFLGDIQLPKDADLGVDGTTRLQRTLGIIAPPMPGQSSKQIQPQPQSRARSVTDDPNEGTMAGAARRLKDAGTDAFAERARGEALPPPPPKWKQDLLLARGIGSMAASQVPECLSGEFRSCAGVGSAALAGVVGVKAVVAMGATEAGVMVLKGYRVISAGYTSYQITNASQALYKNPTSTAKQDLAYEVGKEGISNSLNALKGLGKFAGAAAKLARAA